jgi:hypothetical protein
MSPVNASTPPDHGDWFEHALEWETDPDHGTRPARCMITHIAEPGATTLPQVCYRRIDDPGESLPSSIDIDLFHCLIKRWLTPEETRQAEEQARFRQRSHG